ncbi:AAA family ATPase [Ktedonobacter sp. SOSP1-52]|uniref:AAA family ATPase n=1 Tax=Ktedonobacter sp. SOSP1-52 TaxID=2778366 RepID=UPI0019150A3B|nr:AAA family ATPase [Ktedonobacter sp. SOSP1-52]
MEKASPPIGTVCNGCLVYEQQGQHLTVLLDTPSWYTWLETATTFTFTCDEGTFLEQGLRGPVTLVSAPAGSGKTTLLAEWAATATKPAAWLSCEEAENDPARFLSSLIAALARVDARLDSAAQTDWPWHPHEHEQVLTRLLNDLERLLQHDTVLILDDVHALTTEVSQALLLFLLNHLPSRLHLLLGTRVDLPRLARLRARQQICELPREALGFLSAEVEAFAHAMGLPLSSEAIRLLEEQTEGWIAGIQLLTLALRGYIDAAEVLQTTGVTHRFLLDYVCEEILLRQPPEMQRFLLGPAFWSDSPGRSARALLKSLVASGSSQPCSRKTSSSVRWMTQLPGIATIRSSPKRCAPCSSNRSQRWCRNCIVEPVAGMNSMGGQRRPVSMRIKLPTCLTQHTCWRSWCHLSWNRKACAPETLAGSASAGGHRGLGVSLPCLDLDPAPTHVAAA